MQQHRYFVIHKPRGMVSQFISSHPVNLLGDLNFTFPEGIHAIGRLDADSEGLLLLTTNKKVTRLLFESKEPHRRIYLVNVRNIVCQEALSLLTSGVLIRTGLTETHLAVPDHVDFVPAHHGYACLNEQETYSYPNTWLKITLTEGKFRQVRKMVAAIRHPCRRLIRVSIEGLELGDLKAGNVKEIPENDFFEKLNLREEKK